MHDRYETSNARPATRVDDVVIFEGGASRELTEDERQRLDAGEDVRLNPRSGRRTLVVGEFACERNANVDEVDLRDAGHPTHWRCQACLSTFPLIGDSAEWACPGPWWRET